jgi:hypothetical protein
MAQGWHSLTTANHALTQLFLVYCRLTCRSPKPAHARQIYGQRATDTEGDDVPHVKLQRQRKIRAVFLLEKAGNGKHGWLACDFRALTYQVDEGAVGFGDTPHRPALCGS